MTGPRKLPSRFSLSRPVGREGAERQWAQIETALVQRGEASTEAVDLRTLVASTVTAAGALASGA